MRWFRSCRRLGGALALFALALQLAVGFAHIHPEDFSASSYFPASSDRGRAGVASPDRLPVAAAHVPAAPRDHSGSGVPEHDCAICFSIGLLGNALNGQPPALAPPTSLRYAPLRPVSEAEFSFARYVSFRTRAPPVV